MSLAILGSMVVVGVTLIVALVHMTAPPEAAPLADAEGARRIFGIDHPDLRVFDAVCTADGRSALLHLESGHAGIVHRVGSRHLTRLLARGDHQARLDGRAVEIRLFDLGWSGGRFIFADDGDARRAAAILGILDREKAAA